MSTRRTTRASSRGASPAASGSDVTAATPRTGRRAGRRGATSGDLPPVSGGTSTSYGTNTVGLPNATNARAAAGAQISGNVLQDILEDEDFGEGPSTNTNDVSTTAAAQGGNRSFGQESGLFGAAGVESSAELSDAGQHHEQQSVLRRAQEEAQRIHREATNELNPNCVVQRPTRPEPQAGFRETVHGLLQKGKASIFPIAAALSALFCLYLASAGINHVSSGVQSSNYSVDGYRYYGITDLKHNLGQFIPHFVAHPVTSWAGGDISGVQKQLSALGSDVAFLQHRVDDIQGRSDIHERTIRQFHKLLEGIKQDENGNLELPADFSNAIQQQIQQDPDFRHVVEETVKVEMHKFIDGLRDAFAQATAKSIVEKLNHFSTAVGAVVDPYLTANTYVPPERKTWKKFLSFKVPNPPVAALTSWEEHGDYWCFDNTAANKGKGLAVILANEIYPEEIVVEHIADHLTLAPQVAPKEMVLLAQIEDSDARNEVQRISSKLFDGSLELSTSLNLPDKPSQWVQIAAFTYDNESPHRSQSFPVQIDLRHFDTDTLKTSTSKLLVLSKDNWSNGAQEFTCYYRILLHGDLHQQKLAF